MRESDAAISTVGRSVGARWPADQQRRPHKGKTIGETFHSVGWLVGLCLCLLSNTVMTCINNQVDIYLSICICISIIYRFISRRKISTILHLHLWNATRRDVFLLRLVLLVIVHVALGVNVSSSSSSNDNGWEMRNFSSLWRLFLFI